MCGIVGLISFSKNGMLNSEVSAFTQLLYADEVRGSDGTGIFYNSKKNRGNIKILKGAIPSSVFIKTQKYKDATNTLFNEANFAVGHNRAATKGKVNDECTHPFREKHITLIHNGTLTSQKELSEDAEVDSHAICQSIANIGAKATLEKLNGAFALVWFDGDTKTLHICKNAQRPLFLIKTSSCYIICSELELGLWICQRNNLKVVTQEIIKSQQLYSFHIKSMEEFTEEPVEFLKYSYSENSFWKNQPQSTYLTRKKDFAFGEQVRFKTSAIKISTMDPTIQYLEADILKFQNMSTNYAKIQSDWENEWRIKIFGTKEYLEKWEKRYDISGSIERTFIKTNDTTYIVSNVHETPPTVTVKETPDNIIMLENLNGHTHYNDDDEDTCSWCKGPIHLRTVLYGMNICEVCKAEQDQCVNEYKSLGGEI